MNLIIFGATGRTGSALLEHALHKQYQVTAFVDDPQQLDIASSGSNLRLVIGSVADRAAVDRVIKGQHAALIALGVGTDTTYEGDIVAETEVIVKAMELNGVTRVVAALSEWVFYSSWPDAVTRLAEAQRKQLDVLRASRLAWVAVCPPQITNEPVSLAYRLLADAMPANTRAISRHDLAHFMLSQVLSDHYVGQVVGIAR